MWRTARAVAILLSPFFPNRITALSPPLFSLIACPSSEAGKLGCILQLVEKMQPDSKRGIQFFFLALFGQFTVILNRPQLAAGYSWIPG